MGKPHKNSDKKCPACNGEIDYFGSCRRCGREWSESLEPGEHAIGLPEGQQYDPEVRRVGERKPRRARFTKTKAQLKGEEFKTFAPSVPDKFAAWQIGERDDDTEIVRKRSMMRLDSRKIYNAMGLSVRAHDTQKGVLLYLGGLMEFLSPDEQKGLAPTVERLKRAFAELGQVRRAKIAEAVEMEKALSAAHKGARRARIRQADEAAKRRRAAVEPILPGEDSEGYSVPEPVALPPDKLLEQAKERLVSLDAEKALRKKKGRGRSRPRRRRRSCKTQLFVLFTRVTLHGKREEADHQEAAVRQRVGRQDRGHTQGGQGHRQGRQRQGVRLGRKVHLPQG